MRPASITSFVVPTGYSFNLDGSTLYQSIAAIFIAQPFGIDLSLWQGIVLVLTLMVTSKASHRYTTSSLRGAAGDAGQRRYSRWKTLAFIAGVDRIWAHARTARGG